MSRSYVKVEQLAEEVFRRKEAGETNREIGEHFGLTKDQIKQLVTRQRRKQRMVANGYIIRPKGRPRKREETEEIRRNNELVNLRLQVLFCKIFICVEDSETSRISQKLTPRSLEKSSGVIFYINMLYFSYLSAMLLPMSTPMTEAIIRPLVQPLESPRQWSPLTLVSKLSSIFMRLE